MMRDGVQPALRVLVAVWARNEPVTIRAVLGVLCGRRGGEMAAEMKLPPNKPAKWVDQFLADLAVAGDSAGLDATEARALLFAVERGEGGEEREHEVQRAAAAGGGEGGRVGGDAVGGVPGVPAAQAGGSGAVRQRGLAVPGPGGVPGAGGGQGAAPAPANGKRRAVLKGDK